MKKRHYKSPYIGSAFTDFDSLRYLRAKEQELIKEDDPDFFYPPPVEARDERPQLSLLSKG